MTTSLTFPDSQQQGGGFDRRKQRQQFEAHLPPAEREGFDDDDIGPCGMKSLEQQVAAGMEEVLAYRPTVGIGEAGKAGIAGDDRRQRHGLDALAGKARYRQAASHHSDFEAVLDEGIGDAAGAGAQFAVESTAMVTGPMPRKPNATRPNAKTGAATTRSPAA